MRGSIAGIGPHRAAHKRSGRGRWQPIRSGASTLMESIFPFGATEPDRDSHRQPKALMLQVYATRPDFRLVAGGRFALPQRTWPRRRADLRRKVAGHGTARLCNGPRHSRQPRLKVGTGRINVYHRRPSGDPVFDQRQPRFPPILGGPFASCGHNALRLPGPNIRPQQGIHHARIEGRQPRLPNGTRALDNVTPVGSRRACLGLCWGPTGRANRPCAHHCLPAGAQRGQHPFRRYRRAGPAGCAAAALWSYLPQDFGVYRPHFGAYGNARSHWGGAERHQHVPRNARRWSNICSTRPTLGGCGARRLPAFRAGMRQRFGIAQALIGDPGTDSSSMNPPPGLTRKNATASSTCSRRGIGFRVMFGWLISCPMCRPISFDEWWPDLLPAHGVAGRGKRFTAVAGGWGGWGGGRGREGARVMT